MAKGRSSLAAQLAELTDVAPKDFDPEEGYDLSNARQRAASDEEDSASEDEATGREHYVDVGPSELRRRAAVSEHASLADPKYSGVKATRADLYGDEAESEEGLDDEEMGSEIDEEAASGDDQESGAEEEGDGSEDEVEEEENGSAGDEGEEEDGEVASEDDAEGPSGSAAPPAKTNKKTARFASSATAGSSDDPNSLAAQAEEEARMMRELRARGNADAEKGRAVRKQMSTWDALLDARIRIQKLVQRTARLPPATLLPAFLSSHSDGPSATESTLSALDSLSDQLFDLRSSLAQSNIPSFTVSPDAISSRKRKRASSSSDDLDAHEAALSDLRTLEEALAPHVTSTLNKWSAKVSAASATGQGNKFALKAVNQSAVAQIEAALAGDGFERLVARTRVYRPAASGNDAGRLGVPTANSEAGATSAESATNSTADPEVFDDTDFYQQLLREVIESRGGGDSAAAWSGALRGKKIKKQVDTRASKGRRLRYEIHDKIQNFMPPIPRETWTDDQITKLFSKLGGDASASASAAADVDRTSRDTEKEQPVALGGLRVFG